ncbi:Methanesulfonate monooxygenase, hydroxylase subunit beta [Cupriavidus phytorum]|uniref:Methanesulfonate monooxygenase, hydroxylase subunit beta n=2 Tax=Cupriavidus TaxID=106589 RepID=A0A375CJE7_9BURK|nr:MULTISPECIES: aromatic-ring-hydroxylating dioxygenase subunit beta [Cupriavidus]MCO4887879.1 methanesulfonate monooxygenase [Cupriavidus sp. WGtm5]PZX34253.1 methanesulfonate monooxygenase hydrolase component beta subunit [Cupriavidus alkaliphilus]SOY71843.1 Methanesulfonate monooxygenase, hydroxylase subunit beta [Cupriavidus taiwanensis]
MEIESTVRALIAKTCLALDGNDYAGYLNLCHENFNYRITAYSPEIRKDMLWLEKNKRDLKDLFNLLPKQNMDRTPLTRHFSIFTVEPAGQEGHVKVMSALQVFRTEHQGGTTSLVAVGKYLDEIQVSSDGAVLVDREVRLDTRMLGKGYHVPF